MWNLKFLTLSILQLISELEETLRVDGVMSIDLLIEGKITDVKVCWYDAVSMFGKDLALSNISIVYHYNSLQIYAIDIFALQR